MFQGKQNYKQRKDSYNKQQQYKGGRMLSRWYGDEGRCGEDLTEYGWSAEVSGFSSFFF